METEVMRWAQKQRVAFIGRRLLKGERVNRGDIVKEFGVSLAQAAIDIREFNGAHPGAMKYDRSRKAYVADCLTLAPIQDAVPTSHGWAVLTDEGIDMRTVSDTRRAAIVNWLCTSGTVLVHRGTTDEQIEMMWQDHRGDVRAIPVKVQSAIALDS